MGYDGMTTNQLTRVSFDCFRWDTAASSFEWDTAVGCFDSWRIFTGYEEVWCVVMSVFSVTSK